MPLKHSTETLLTIVLGLVLLLTGFVIAFLPPIKDGYAAWGIAFGFSLLYPLLLYPLFRDRRADNAFRALHFLPALFLLAWFVLQMIHPFAGVARAESLYKFGWSLPLVAVSFLLLIIFCLRVLRQRRLRVVLLLLLFVPFAVFAVLSEQRGWNPVIASVLDTDTWKLPGRFWIASKPTAEEQSSEEAWQMQQRRMERRGERLSSESNQPKSSVSKLASSKRPQGSSRPAIAKNTPPPTLPPSGFGSEVMIPLMLAGYTSTVHWRARRRVKQ